MELNGAKSLPDAFCQGDRTTEGKKVPKGSDRSIIHIAMISSSITYANRVTTTVKALLQCTT